MNDAHPKGDCLSEFKARSPSLGIRNASRFLPLRLAAALIPTIVLLQIRFGGGIEELQLPVEIHFPRTIHSIVCVPSLPAAEFVNEME